MPSFGSHAFKQVRNGYVLSDFTPKLVVDDEHIPFSNDDVVSYGGATKETAQMNILIPLADVSVWKSLGGVVATMTWYFGQSFLAQLVAIGNGQFIYDGSGYLLDVTFKKV